MAFYDDSKFLISHIRNSYITSDGSGTCEQVMIRDDYPCKVFPLASAQPAWVLEPNDNSTDANGSELSQSSDIASDMDFSGRPRSNTAQKLDRLKIERETEAKIMNVFWTKPEEPIPADEMAEHFQKKEISEPPTTKTHSKSLLAEKLQEFPIIPNNPFSDYAKFDGRTCVDVPTRKISIFLTMLPPDKRPFPMQVVTLATARVLDVIGLICYHYTNEYSEPKLKVNVDSYSLNIAEDDGELDMDFPCLETNELISKFGFRILALAEKDPPENVQENETVVTVWMPTQDFTSIAVDSKIITMQDILDLTMKRRMFKRRNKSLDYCLEKLYVPNIAVDLNSTLAKMETLEFCIVRKNSKRTQLPEKRRDKVAWHSTFMTEMEAPLYQSYRVLMIQKVHFRSEVELGISGEKIEIDPINQKGAAKLFARSQKPANYDIDMIAACYLTSGDKFDTKATFRLVYKINCSNSDFKHHDFEADSAVASKIVEQVKLILQMRPSNVRREYAASGQRKMPRMQSLRLSKSEASSKPSSMFNKYMYNHES